MRNRGLIFLLHNSMQATNRPQVSFIPKTRGRFKDDFPKSLLVQAFQQARAATYLFSLKSRQAICIMSSNPPKERGSINTKGVGNIAHRQATGNSFNGSDPNLKGRVPSLVTIFHNRELNNNQASYVNTMLQNFCDGPYVLDDHYLKRNPHVLYPDTRVNVSIMPGAARVYPISRPLPRFNSPQALNHFTGACGTIIYRDTLFGKEFEGNMFVSEPVHNLVHREIMKPKGVTFTSQRADDEKESEFLASSDNWFRPTMIQVGPDGALWIADMYRYVIEHPEWIPKDWQKKLDLPAGHELGRIFRVYPADKKPREIVRLDNMKVEELVKQLESPSGWVRDMAQQLFISKTAKDEKLALKAGELLEELMKKSDSPKARLHALYYPAGVTSFGWGPDSLGDWMVDPHPAIRKHSTALCAEWNTLRRYEKTLDRLEHDTDPQVAAARVQPGQLHQTGELLRAARPHDVQERRRSLYPRGGAKLGF